MVTNFYPRPPRGGRPLGERLDRAAALISIHALREEGDSYYHTQALLSRISIHALREEGDALRTPTITTTSDFYPRPPRGGRLIAGGANFPVAKFLSTPSARRATRYLRNFFLRSIDFYPRPPRGGRPAGVGAAPNGGEISIHALREEGDGRHDHQGDRMEISIHALREEGDGARFSISTSSVNFYPRPPRGGRRAEGSHHQPRAGISIHALREEGDGVSHVRGADQINFYPRPPRGGRRTKNPKSVAFWLFLSTPSARRATGA